MSKRTKKIRYRKSDFLRVLLTETLPYEVPLPFSNDGYYQRLIDKTADRIEEFVRKPFFETENHTIPYDYKIKKDSHDDRNLSVIHPATQKRFCKFYGDYGSLIIGLCSRSTYSIRRPKRIASHFFERILGANMDFGVAPSVETASYGFDRQAKVATSYFSYHRHGLVYRFFDSLEFIDLEKKFKLFRALDISKCFHHIYTHTISWAVKNKKYAKRNRGHSFENNFDRLMQHSNYDETNGIIVGPIPEIF